jgi:hypothetical protein
MLGGNGVVLVRRVPLVRGVNEAKVRASREDVKYLMGNGQWDHPQNDKGR